jgi:hypothetical protein
MDAGYLGALWRELRISRSDHLDIIRMDECVPCQTCKFVSLITEHAVARRRYVEAMAHIVVQEKDVVGLLSWAMRIYLAIRHNIFCSDIHRLLLP